MYSGLTEKKDIIKIDIIIDTYVTRDTEVVCAGRVNNPNLFSEVREPIVIDSHHVGLVEELVEVDDKLHVVPMAHVLEELLVQTVQTAVVTRREFSARQTGDRLDGFMLGGGGAYVNRGRGLR